MAAENKTVIFWGAGATAALGFRITDHHGKFIRHLTGAVEPTPLSVRIANALGASNVAPWTSALSDLITILGDTPEADESIESIGPDELAAMRRSWYPGATDDTLRKRIYALRLVYDWPALKKIVKICPGVAADHFTINDLFNVMDMHLPVGHGFRDDEGQFLTARRLLGAKDALKMILLALFYIDYQICLSTKRDLINHYYDFAAALGRRMQRAAHHLSDQFNLDQPEFFRGDVSFVSLNYDPFFLWMQFVANRDLNQNPSVPHIGSPAAQLEIFHDLGHFIPSRRIGRGNPNHPWFPMNEAAAQRLNEQDSGSKQKIRLTKFLFPHGSLCWRECPDCGKLSAYHGDTWSRFSPGLIPPPPLKIFEQNPLDSRIDGDEAKRWREGGVDARACLHCETLTSAHNTQTVMQSSFKQQPPSFIEEIQRDLRATVMRADHIILMGYSLPPDDVTYRSFFAARRQRGEGGGDAGSLVRCTVVGIDSKNPGWVAPGALNLDHFDRRSAVHAACDIFGKQNVRFFGGGVPNVFFDGANIVTDASLEKLLNWSL